MGLKIFLVVFAATVAMAAYWLYSPIPPGYSTQTTRHMRLTMATVKICQALCRIGSWLGFGTYETNTRILSKTLMGSMIRTPIDGIQTTDAVFDGVSVRIYEPLDNLKGETLPGVVYYHGGGWVFGSIDSVDDLVKRMSKATKAIFVSVEYRLAPEFLFPAALEDCVIATKFFLMNAVKFHVDPKRVAVSGESAGGNLAATVSLKLRDEKFIHQPKLQVLIYPVIQGLDFDLPSMLQNSDGPLLTRHMMVYFTAAYLAGNSYYESVMTDNRHVIKSYRKQMASTFFNLDHLPNEFLVGYKRPDYPEGDEKVWNDLKEKLLNPYYSPLTADNLQNLPTAFVYLAYFDPLRDEGWLYAEKLKKAKVNVHVHMAENGFHGIANFVGVYPEADLEFKNITDFIVANL